LACDIAGVRIFLCACRALSAFYCRLSLSPFSLSPHRLVHQSAMENPTFVLDAAPRPSQPQRLISYPSLAQDADHLNEKAASDIYKIRPAHTGHLPSPAQSSAAQWTPYAYDSEPDTGRSYPATPPTSHFLRHPSSHRRSLTYSSRGRGPVLAAVLRPWIPLILYAITSLAFVVAIAFYKTELFTCAYRHIWPYTNSHIN